MKPRILPVVFALIILALAVSMVGADDDGPRRIEPLVQPQPSAETGEMVNETPMAWFVEFESPPTLEGGSQKQAKAEQAKFYAAAKAAGIDVTERYSFSTLWNGISITLDPADVNKLSSLPGVKAVYPVEKIAMPETTSSASPELYTAIAMTGADIAQSELGFTGAGVKVAVMDTGIDYDHPDLGGCFGPGCRVAYGYDLVGDDFSAGVNDTRVPDPDPDDCGGHGTHVAGIVGANGVVVGVAPEVTFGAYRVFGCSGSTWADIMIEAMEMALKDKMDILNMSIGSAFTWPEYPTAVASNNLVKHGMVVVASIGNSGTSGLYSAGAPGLGEDVIGVASFDNTNALLPYFEVAGSKISYGGMAFADPAPTAGTEEIVYIGLACDGMPLEADPAGKVALASRGACSFRSKALNAQAAGATAVVVHNSSSGNFSGTLGSPAVAFPAVSISLEDGLFIRSQAAPIEITWTDQLASFVSPTGGLISSFSSYGLSPDLSLKPDIGAPGGDIYSTIPLEQGGYGVKGGTSMASPHVAGAAALLLQAHPGLDAYEVRDVLQNSADPMPWSLAPFPGYYEYVHRQGAGMVDIDDAILATTYITPAKIAVGEGEAGPYTQELTIMNNGDAAVTYDLSFAESIATEGVTSVDGYYLGGVFVDFDQPSVTVQPGESATVVATIYNGYWDYITFGGYIVFTPQGDGQSYSVPFAGVGGDYQAIQVLTPTAYGFPTLGWTPDGVNFGFAGEGDVFTLEGFDLPYLLVHLDHQAELMRVEIFTAEGKSLHPVFSTAIYEEYLPRNSSANGFFAFAWDGSRIHSNGYNGNGYTKNLTKPVADGDYYLVLSVLKANGDAENPDHWETWTSPVFTIDRP
jgi:subtilisin family serine protease